MVDFIRRFILKIIQEKGLEFHSMQKGILNKA